MIKSLNDAQVSGIALFPTVILLIEFVGWVA
jgi:hypothetical protein